MADSTDKKKKRAPRRRRWWFYFVWVVYIGLIAEGGLRIAAFCMSRSSGDIRTNQEGRVIYCIGDSFTFGQGVEPDQAYPQVLEGMFAEAGLTEKYRVENLGIPGLSSSTALYHTAQAIKSNDAALLIVMTGWNANNNDFQLHRLEQNISVPWSTRLNNVCEYSHVYRLIRHVATFRQRTVALDNVELVPLTTAMDLYEFRAYQEIAKTNLEKIVDLCDETDTPIVLLNYPYRDLPPNPFSKNEYYHVVFGRTAVTDEDYIIADREPDEIAIHSVIRHVANTNDVPLIDLHEALKDSDPDKIFQDDFHHPTALGLRQIAKHVFKKIAPQLTNE